MPIAKATKTGLKRGRKGKGRKAISPEIKAKAKAAGFTSVKKWEEAGKPGPKRKASQKRGTAKRKDTEIPKGKRGSEIRRLERQQKADDMESVGGPRRRNIEGVAEGPNRPALSKVQPPKMSAAQRRRRVAQGLVGGPRAGRREQVRDIGEYAPPASQIADEMGLSGMIDADEIMELGGFEIRKSGGQIKYKKKGGPIGCGAAQRGYGKVRS
jgi:hypothetical protein